MDLLCSKCNEVKPATEFFKESRGARGYRYNCKDCEKSRYKKYRESNRDKVNKNVLNWRRAKKFNFPAKLVEQRFKEQGNACAICGSDTAGGRGEFHADHNHETNSPRGILCHKCNVALGCFNDDVAILQAAISYLRKYSEVE